MGRVCVITGASQGIGRAAAVRMSQEPDVSALILIARNAAGLDETAAAMKRDGKDVELIPYDLMDLDGIPALRSEGTRLNSSHSSPSRMPSSA